MSDKPGTWKPGQSGNPKGRPKRRTITEELCKLLDQPDETGKQGWQQVAELLLRLAKEGDRAMLKDLVDRTDGKPKQTVELGGIEDQPLGITIVRPEKNGSDGRDDKPNGSGTPGVAA